MDFQALSERLKDAPDSGYNGQMPLATLKDQNKSLSVPEILHLLRLAFTNHLVPAISYHSTSSVWKRKGCYQITRDLDSHLAFRRFVDLN